MIERMVVIVAVVVAVTGAGGRGRGSGVSAWGINQGDIPNTRTVIGERPVLHHVLYIANIPHEKASVGIDSAELWGGSLRRACHHTHSVAGRIAEFYFMWTQSLGQRESC